MLKNSNFAAGGTKGSLPVSRDSISINIFYLYLIFIKFLMQYKKFEDHYTNIFALFYTRGIRAFDSINDQQLFKLFGFPRYA